MISYKDYKIKQIYQSADGRGNHDYFISGGKLPASGEVKMATTVTKIREYLDAKTCPSTEH